MCLAQGPQRSDAGEARTRGLSVSSQALYHWVTALPLMRLNILRENNNQGFNGFKKKSTFQKFSHLNALGSKFDLDVK